MTTPPTTSHRAAAIEAVTFLSAIVLANWLTHRYGFARLHPTALVTTWGTFAAGATFTVRDALQDRLGRWWIVALIVAGAALSAIVSPSLAVASGTAFMLSEMLDLAVYTPLRSRSWDLAVWLSALVGSIADSLLFLWLAFGAAAVTLDAAAGQVLGKLLATLVIWLVLRWRR